MRWPSLACVKISQHFTYMDFWFLFAVLCSLSSADLSAHAVELEKRSIQLSLEEGQLSIF